MYLFKAILSFKDDNTFERNKAITGGAIHLNEGQLIFSGSNSTLVSNEADDGGAVYASESNCIVKEDSQTEIHANSSRWWLIFSNK